MLKISGVALLAFSYFAVLQFLSGGCSITGPALSPGSSFYFTCFLGVDLLLVPFLLAAGAGILLLGTFLDRQPMKERFARAPPGLGFVVLGGGVLEIATTYVISPWAWVISPLAPALLAGGVVLLAAGGWSWWNSRAEGTSSLSVRPTTGSERLEEGIGPAAPPEGGTWPGILTALSIALSAFGLFALVIGLVSKDGRASVPSYWSYDPGLEPSTSVPIVISGGVLLLAGALFVPPPRWRDFLATRWSLAFLILGGGVLEAGVALVLFGNHYFGWTVSVYAPTLLVAGGLMVARGASPPSLKQNRARLLIVLGPTGLVLNLVNIGYLVWTRGSPLQFVSNAGWTNYLGDVILAEATYVGVAYGLLFFNASILRKGTMDDSRHERGFDPGNERRVGLTLCISAALIFATMVGWFIFVGGMWFPTPYIVVGVSVHAVPLLAVLLSLGSPWRPTGPSIHA